MPYFFDLDGTLTDPGEGIVACLRHALGSLDIAVDDDVDLESYIGPPLHETFRALCPDHRLVEPAVKIYRERFRAVGLYENRLHDGIDQCLRRLAEGGSRSYVVTSKPTVFAQRIVEHFAIDGHFTRVYGSNLDGSLGDKSELIAHVLEAEQVAPARAVMIGDRKYDILGARSNGVASIGVLWGYGSDRELRDAGADALCAHPAELPQAALAANAASCGAAATDGTGAC